MNKTTRLHDREVRLLDDALAALTRNTGLTAAIVTREPLRATGARPDAEIQIEANGKRFQFFAEIKTIDRAVALATAKNQLAPHGNRGVLVAPYITAELANHCRNKLDLHFIDTAGNAYLRAPGLYVFVRGERPPNLREMGMGTRGGGTATALRVVFALLCNPELLNAPYREIVAAAGVALGAVGWVFFDLQGRGYITGGLRKHNRRLLEPARLLDEWVTNFPIKLRPKLNPRRFQAPDPGWWRQARLEAGARWGGEIAAAKLTDDLKPAICTIYLHPENAREALPALVKQHRLRADPHGNVEILDAFWNFQPKGTQPDLVPPLLVYADLMATFDPRNLQVARQIRGEYIDHALRRA
ncbi:MAG: type IV toxin-antitoxin system AbiEi family antitoxin [Candidatus Rokubacteria bacterium]|nr:type IV toxin-antitoxin system AbiEi family antitoxin [Candidatus Rokubacteria bacterium]